MIMPTVINTSAARLCRLAAWAPSFKIIAERMVPKTGMAKL